MVDTPRVTIGVTTYNVERYLAGAFDAVLAQDFEDFEVVVCDNQSTDGTWAICQQYAEKDARWRIFRNPTNVGQAGNFARVLSQARGEYFRLTSHDDLIAPTLLSRCVEVLDTNPGAVLAFPRTVVIDENGATLVEFDGDQDLRDRSASRRINAYVRHWSLVNELFGLIRTSALRAVSPFGQYVSADKQLLVELLARGGFYLVPGYLFYRRLHGANTFGQHRTATEVYAWLEPGVVEQRRVPARYSSPRGDHTKLTVATTRALVRANLPVGARAAATGTFLATWELRRAHIFLGRWRRRILRWPRTRTQATTMAK